MEREEYTRRLQFEHDLINRRLTWLLTSQSILFAAYGFALDAEAPRFLKTVAITGIAISFFIFVGIVAAFFAKRLIWLDFRRIPGNEREPFWVRTWITYMGLVPDLSLPIVFAVAWIVLYPR